MVDLYFTYRDELPRLCRELDNLREDEIAVILEALKRLFDTIEQDAFSFSIKKEDDYSPLQLVIRQRDGNWMDSGMSSVEYLSLSIRTSLNPEVGYDAATDNQQRWVDVWQIAHIFAREISQLRRELCKEPSSILKHVPRDELLDRLAKIAPVVMRQKQREGVVEEAQGGSEKDLNAVVSEGEGDEKEEQAPALKQNELVTLKALALFGPNRLATSTDVGNEMTPADRLSPRTIQPAIRRLMELDLAERPEGDKHGARATLKGQRLVLDIAD